MFEPGVIDFNKEADAKLIHRHRNPFHRARLLIARQHVYSSKYFTSKQNHDVPNDD